MSDTPTPETNALTSVGLENADRECVPADFARQLERERDEARKAFESLWQLADPFLPEIDEQVLEGWDRAIRGIR